MKMMEVKQEYLKSKGDASVAVSTLANMRVYWLSLHLLRSEGLMTPIEG